MQSGGNHKLNPEKCQWSKTKNDEKLLYSVATMLIMCGQSIAIDSCE